MRRALIISNPMAARAGDRALESGRQRLAEGGMSVEVARTTGPGDAERFARAAVADGVDVLIAHGGDGTAMEVTAALVGTDRPLGLMPAGTGNLLAGNLGLGRQARGAAEAILGGVTRAIDVGRLTTSSGTRYFAVAAGMGFDAELMHRTPTARKRAFGIGAYVATAVGLATDITRARLRIETEDAVVETVAALVLVANCREIVPGVLPLPAGVSPDDGMLDVVVLDAQSLPGAARVAWRLLLRQSEGDPSITRIPARRVRIDSDVPLAVQADGEACGTAPLEVEVVPRGLRVLVPPHGRA